MKNKRYLMHETALTGGGQKGGQNGGQLLSTPIWHKILLKIRIFKMVDFESFPVHLVAKGCQK